MKLIKRQTIKNVANSSKNFLAYQRTIFGLFLLSIVLLTVKVYYSNQLAVSGAAVNYSERRAQQLEKENYQLENEISLKSSLVYIENKAKEAGLVKITKVETLKPISLVAIKQ